MAVRSLGTLIKLKEKNGFNTIRLLAAFAVIFSHSFLMVGLEEPLGRLTGQATIGALAVAAFFVISGMLISESFDRSTIADFAFKRAKRIMPALVVAVVVCAFVIGPLATSLPIWQYFSAPETWKFLHHAIFIPTNYGLPGVFAGNEVSGVNGSLWSLKFEVACYVIAAMSLALRGLRVPVIVAGWLASFAIARALPDGSGALYYLNLVAELFRFFGTGMLFYLFRDRISVRADWGWVAFAMFVGSAFTPLFLEAAATFGAYALLVAAYHCGPAFKTFTRRADEDFDISYGVYVYAFPIQQIVAPLCVGLPLPWLVNASLTIPLVICAGAASWWYVERPASKRNPPWRRAIVPA